MLIAHIYRDNLESTLGSVHPNDEGVFANSGRDFDILADHPSVVGNIEISTRAADPMLGLYS